LLLRRAASALAFPPSNRAIRTIEKAQEVCSSRPAQERHILCNCQKSLIAAQSIVW
jgi:hypothetical protein